MNLTEKYFESMFPETKEPNIKLVPIIKNGNVYFEFKADQKRFKIFLSSIYNLFVVFVNRW